jgi:hypothetical protein
MTATKSSFIRLRRNPKPMTGVDRFGRLILASAAAFALVAGCAKPPQTVVVEPSSQRRVSTGVGVGRAQRNAPAPQQSAAAQTVEVEVDCATRLHDLTGHLLLYYTINGRLPDRLEDVATVADDFDPRSLACPTSHQPYVYNPRGLTAPGSARLLVLYDATPAHGGVRWGLMIDPPQSKQTLLTRVEPLSEQQLLQYAASPADGLSAQ